MNKKFVYLDNGATSFPKAPNVAKAMSDYIINNGTSISRGIYKSSMEASRVVYETREALCNLFGFDLPENVVFTKNITESMNVILKGLLNKSDHVITSSLEHNAVMRPLNSISCEITRINGSLEGYINPEDIKNEIKTNTKAIIINHGSNVCGSVNDIEAIGKIAKDNNIYFIVDAAQTAGIIDIDMKKSNIDALGFTGHKSLLGPNGIGGFIITTELSNHVKPLIEGGTGSASESEVQPTYLPDKFEAGTPNIVGIYGLLEGIKFVSETGITTIHEKEMKLVERFLNNFSNKNVKIIGPKEIFSRTGVISLDFTSFDNAEVAFILEKKYGIATRVGMHCAPSAHKTLNTFPNGTLRISFSYFTTEEEIDYLIESLNTILE